MKMCLKNKILSFVFVLAIFSLSFCCVEKVYAEELETTLCEFTDEYIAWNKLSDEEKKNTTKPPMCDYDATEYNRVKTNIKSSFDSFTKVKLPAKYDIRNTEYKATMRNQMNTGGCWAFSAATALEIFTKISLGLDYVYSARHIEYATSRYFLNDEVNDWGFNRTPGDGGHVLFSSAYLTSQVGPVLEEEMPFENNENLIELSAIKNKTKVIDVNGVSLNGLNNYNPCNSTMITAMKEQVYKTGGAVSSIYMTGDSNYYNSNKSALYYNGSEYPNHAIVVVGWDDTYSKTNFATAHQPSSDGAWIVQNSYGSTFGEGGYNYVSYEDERICTVFMGINDIDTEVEDNAYIYDRLGYEFALGYKGTDGATLPSGHGLAVYSKEKKTEILKEVTFGTTGVGKYKIYYKAGDASRSTVSSMTLIGEGNIDYKGYMTHKLETPIYIDWDVEEFSIAVYWELNSNSNPIPISSTASPDYFYLESKAGETFYSYGGYAWVDAYNSGYIVSIKAFTDNVTYSLDSKLNSVKQGNSNNVVVDLGFTSTNIFVEDLNITVKDSNDDFINDFNVTYTKDDSGNPTAASIDFYNNLDNGTYTANVYYQNNFIEEITFTVEFGIVSRVYSISSTDKTIYLSSPTRVTTFLSNLTGNKGALKKDGVVVGTGYVGTGMVIDGYVVILKGDVTGDGFIKVNDVMMISKYTVEGVGLDSIYVKKAADVTGDTLIKVNDVMKISKYTVEGGTL